MDLEGERAMKEAIWGCLAKRIGKMKNLLNCQAIEQMTGRTLPESASRNSFHTRLQKASQHARPTEQKRNTHRFALMSLRILLVFMSVCMSLLLTLAVQGITDSPARAVAPVPPPGGFDLYPQDSLCVSFTIEQVPATWQDPAYGNVCAATVGTVYVQPSGGGGCQQHWVKTMTQTGQEECVLTVPALRSECPVGFALERGQCE